ncbi:UNKNOWN [Stylonychia lemnae]|uniref:Uncharacterized protein n=1 Tax=Stylonychia lemnae TaxID=5949 RepID=A0A078AY39_STYLE|nr:UNKNOWN [Stylonychia lemnae]|eukprot:CDW87340.1 UNKNOWN [Stylonychia lemnae]
MSPNQYCQDQCISSCETPVDTQDVKTCYNQCCGSTEKLIRNLNLEKTDQFIEDISNQNSDKIVVDFNLCKNQCQYQQQSSGCFDRCFLTDNIIQYKSFQQQPSLDLSLMQECERVCPDPNEICITMCKQNAYEILSLQQLQQNKILLEDHSDQQKIDSNEMKAYYSCIVYCNFDDQACLEKCAQNSFNASLTSIETSQKQRKQALLQIKHSQTLINVGRDVSDSSDPDSIYQQIINEDIKQKISASILNLQNLEDPVCSRDCFNRYADNEPFRIMKDCIEIRCQDESKLHQKINLKNKTVKMQQLKSQLKFDRFEQDYYPDLDFTDELVASCSLKCFSFQTKYAFSILRPCLEEICLANSNMSSPNQSYLVSMIQPLGEQIKDKYDAKTVMKICMSISFGFGALYTVLQVKQLRKDNIYYDSTKRNF